MAAQMSNCEVCARDVVESALELCMGCPYPGAPLVCPNCVAEYNCNDPNGTDRLPTACGACRPKCPECSEPAPIAVLNNSLRELNSWKAGDCQDCATKEFMGYFGEGVWCGHCRKLRACGGLCERCDRSRQAAHIGGTAGVKPLDGFF